MVDVGRRRVVLALLGVAAPAVVGVPRHDGRRVPREAAAKLVVLAVGAPLMRAAVVDHHVRYDLQDVKERSVLVCVCVCMYV